MSWEAVDRKSNEEIRIDMVGLFEVGPSGQFSSAAFTSIPPRPRRSQTWASERDYE